MTLDFEFHPEARAEFIADIDWYDGREPGLGESFENAVRSAIDDTTESPQAWPPWPGWCREPMVRSRSVNGFPYRIVYFVAGSQLMIVAVAHEKRRPGYWRNRTS